MGAKESDALSFEKLTCDAVEVAEHLCARLGKERIFLLASSIGSCWGLRVVRRRPHLFYAYIGTDQNVGMARDREANFNEVDERLRVLEMRKGVETLRHIGPDPAGLSVDEYDAVARWTMRSDPRGYRRTMKLLKNAVWYAPGWKFRDIRAFVRGMRHSLEALLPEIARFDAWQDGTKFEVPFFIFQGEADVLTTARLARAFFDDVAAPQKRFTVISDAGHFAAFLQPDEFLRQLLVDVRPLAREGCEVRGGYDAESAAAGVGP
jgi:pimeloyl-ACP methyl ester carboxylesterase